MSIAYLSHFAAAASVGSVSLCGGAWSIMPVRTKSTTPNLKSKCKIPGPHVPSKYYSVLSTPELLAVSPAGVPLPPHPQGIHDPPAPLAADGVAR